MLGANGDWSPNAAHYLVRPQTTREPHNHTIQGRIIMITVAKIDEHLRHLQTLVDADMEELGAIFPRASIHYNGVTGYVNIAQSTADYRVTLVLGHNYICTYINGRPWDGKRDMNKRMANTLIRLANENSGPIARFWADSKLLQDYKRQYVERTSWRVFDESHNVVEHHHSERSAKIGQESRYPGGYVREPIN